MKRRHAFSDAARSKRYRQRLSECPCCQQMLFPYELGQHVLAAGRRQLNLEADESAAPAGGHDSTITPPNNSSDSCAAAGLSEASSFGSDSSDSRSGSDELHDGGAANRGTSPERDSSGESDFRAPAASDGPAGAALRAARAKARAAARMSEPLFTESDMTVGDLARLLSVVTARHKPSEPHAGDNWDMLRSVLPAEHSVPGVSAMQRLVAQVQFKSVDICWRGCCVYTNAALNCDPKGTRQLLGAMRCPWCKSRRFVLQKGKRSPKCVFRYFELGDVIQLFWADPEFARGSNRTQHAPSEIMQVDSLLYHACLLASSCAGNWVHFDSRRITWTAQRVSGMCLTVRRCPPTCAITPPRSFSTHFNLTAKTSQPARRTLTPGPPLDRSARFSHSKSTVDSCPFPE